MIGALCATCALRVKYLQLIIVAIVVKVQKSKQGLRWLISSRRRSNEEGIKIHMAIGVEITILKNANRR